jgi:transposase InsO family protein
VVVQNGFAESFVARRRDEFLDGEVLLSVLDAQVKRSLFRRYYNEELLHKQRLHSRIGYRTPRAFAAAWQGTNGAVETKDEVGATRGG